MQEALNDDQSRHECVDVLTDLSDMIKDLPPLVTSNINGNRVEVVMRLLRDFAISSRYNNNNNNNENQFDKQEEENRYADTENINTLVHRIQNNDPTLTTLALRNVQVLNQGQPVSCFRGFTQNSIQQATEALHTNETIRSVSCRYDWRYPRRIIRLLCNRDEEHRDQDANDDRCDLRATPHHQVTKLQERRFFEACMCLPQLESISLTGGNRWRVSHLITILDTAKGLKQLIVRDVVVKSSMELNGLERFMLENKRRNYAPLFLESIALTIEDQTHRGDEYWSTTPMINEDESPFDNLIEFLVSFPNIREIRLSKSILSRFHLRQVHDVSTKSLLKLARCKSLSKLVISEISLEQGAVEAMCESLIQNNDHLTHLEFYGCAFNQSVGQSGWNAMFRLIGQDPNIQIRASSMVYLERRRQSKTQVQDTPQGEEIKLSSFVQRPREDFSFSLRDKEGSERHFRNRSLDVRYVLQGAGFFRLLRSKHRANNNDWIGVMAKVTDDSVALFYILRENPSLCNRAGLTGRYRLVRGNKKVNREKGKRTNASPLPLHRLRTNNIQFTASPSLPWPCLCPLN